MSGAIPRPPPAATPLVGSTLRGSFLLGGFLGLLLGVDVCLASGLSGHRWPMARDLASLGCLLGQTLFLTLLVRRTKHSVPIASLTWIGNFLLVNAVVAIYSAQHPSHNRFASSLLAGQMAFLAVWLVLGTQSLGWRMLGTFAAAGILIVGWYGYAARRSTADWNLVWMSQAVGVTAAAVLLKIAGFRIRRLGEPELNAAGQRRENQAEGKGQFHLWHLLAGLSVASCLLGLARLLGIIKPTYFATLLANEIDAADLQRGFGVGLAAALAVAFAALSVLLRANLAARYIPPLIYAAAMGYAIHTWGPPYVDATAVRSPLNSNLLGWSPTNSQWPLWMLLNCGIAMGGAMFLHALGYRLVRAAHR